MKGARLSVFAVSILGLTVAYAPTPAAAGAIKVYPGESIQAAVDAAVPGDKIVVYPGTYTETHGGFNAVRVNKSLKMLGKSKGTEKVVLLAGPGQEDGIVVEPDSGDPDIDGFRIKGFTVQGFPGNGIHLRYVNNFRIEKNESIDNLENGIFPTLSANGMVKRNVSYGSEDSALWVEASENVRVLDNILHDSPTGLEITVSCEEAAFEGTGVILLGAVLAEFFARYASVNSFTETVLRTHERGEVMRWPPISGRSLIL
jgi:nitrous oxidase accessory protein NosD